MKLFPQHLRDRQHAQIIRRRSYGMQGKGDTQGYDFAAKPLPAPQIGALGKLWKKNSGLTDKQAATGLSAASMSTLGTMWSIPSLVGSMGFLFSMIAFEKTGHAEPMAVAAATTAALTFLSAVPWAGAAFRSNYKHPLRDAEIDYLLENESTTASELELAYLRLIRDAVRQSTSVSEETETEIQSAITALGEAIDRLPVISVTALDTDALRQEAEKLRAEALHQSDPVISESLERRADAVQRRAEANDRSALGVRRTTALRAEIESQIAALREGIAALDTGYASADHATASDLALLSESARRVAAEATSAASARAELDAPPAYTSPATTAETQTIMVGRR